MSVAELFARDPLDLTDDDLHKMVQMLRAERAKYISQPKPSRGRASTPSPSANLDLEGLE